MKTRYKIFIPVTAVIGIVVILAFIQAQDPAFPIGYPRISQDDLYCGTVWTVQLDSKVDSKTFEKSIRDKIAEFGSQYDIPKREIKMQDLGENRTKITVGGLWKNGPDVPDLGASIADIEHVKEVENSGNKTIAWCQ